jgi:hypothetical protein
MVCDEKGRLLNAYHATVAEWSHVTEILQDGAVNLLHRANELRARALAAKEAYNAHKTEHGC